MARAVRQCVLRLVPAERRDWVEAVLTEASEVPSGLRRLAWYASAVRLIAGEALARRRVGSAPLLVGAAALALWYAWPGASAGFADSVARVDLVTMVLLLAAVAVIGRSVFGPSVDNRTAKCLRFGVYVGVLILVPAKNVVEQVLDAPPRGGLDLRLYHLISDPGFGNHWRNEIIFLVVIGLYLAVIVWMTSLRSRIAPATLTIGALCGAVLGIVMCALGPIGLGGAPTNPWLPGSDSDPLLVLAFCALFAGPVVAAALANRRYKASGSSAQPRSFRLRQIIGAGLLTNMVGALFVTVIGTGTVAASLKAVWLRSWLYHGQRQFFGLGGLRLLLRGHPEAVSYSHSITAAVDAPPYLIICIVFPLIALVLTGLAMVSRTNVPVDPSDGGRGDGGPRSPQRPPEPPRGSEQRSGTDDHVDSPAGRAPTRERVLVLQGAAP